MRFSALRHRLLPGLAIGVATLLAGCGVISVEMTSTPEVVRSGEPVTFDIKLTNRSQCPTLPPQIELLAFASTEDFFFGLTGELPPDADPEFAEIIQELIAFFDVLCAGGTPDPPTLPAATTACARGDSEIVCTATGPAPAGNSGGSFSLATLGDRLRCTVDAGTASCQLHIPLPPAGANAGSGSAAAAAATPLECVSFAEFNEAFCAVGSLENPLGLAPGQMATGQAVLPARGSGPVRNLVIVIQDSEDDVGVCKGGANGGGACEIDDGDCPGSTCGAGICAGGMNPGLGCDTSTAAMDCPGGECVLCEETTAPGLPLDCTTTYISPNTAPAASPWGLAALAVGLCAAGMWLVQRRLRRHQA